MEKIGEVKGKGNRKEIDIDIKGKIKGNGKIERKIIVETERKGKV